MTTRFKNPYLQQAYEYGKIAFKFEQSRVAIMDASFAKFSISSIDPEFPSYNQLLEAWYEGWDIANLQSEILF